MRRLLGYGRVLVVTAVDAERQAVLRGLAAGGTAEADEHAPVVVRAAGVGPAAAAAFTGHLLAEAALRNRRFDAVISAGIGGGFADRVEVGGLAVGTESIAADLGAAGPDGFIPLEELGFGTSRLPADPALLANLRAALPAAVNGPVLTVSTVTGTAETAGAVRKRHPDAVAEAMEGYGVAAATRLAEGVAFGEIRAISNAVGPRDRSAWRIADALDALAAGFARLANHDFNSSPRTFGA